MNSMNECNRFLGDVYAVGGYDENNENSQAKIEKLTNSGWEIVEMTHWNAIEGFGAVPSLMNNFGIVSLE